ncbi:DUF389 domain-containing protein [Gloeobacter morelensis]|uniref:DUF389 domain-containing protein n=1 Tax=Gloeobacter morelensis MG652769 TaxID=2781736 RepID=A0ABY3PN12_9CYAN|nr:DUF389 domain-containing protein [Gloeobacter morelensis]UFP95052.1 DUF389 domain-containing protein [Gloeobacter morelensis MG652769]
MTTPATVDGAQRSRWFVRRSQEETDHLRTDLTGESTCNFSFLVLVVGSCAIATFGLISNSAAVIIGAMIIAPLMLPIRGFALGAADGDFGLVRTALVSIGVGTVFALGFSWSIGRLVDLPVYSSEILARTQPQLLDLGVAVAAGLVGAYAKLRKEIADSLAGVAIAVALMPPLCVVGLTLAQLDWQACLGATLLYLTNLIGIALACMVVFLAAGYVPFERGGRTLAWTAVFAALLGIPLSISFGRLLVQERLEASLRSALSKTVTFRQTKILSEEVDWLSDPPVVTLRVSAEQAPTPRQVQLLEEYAGRATGQRFKLVARVIREEAITSTGESP